MYGTHYVPENVPRAELETVNRSSVWKTDNYVSIGVGGGGG